MRGLVYCVLCGQNLEFQGDAKSGESIVGQWSLTMRNRVQFAVCSRRFGLLIPLVIALMGTGCVTVTRGPTAGELQTEQEPDPIAAHVRTEAERVSGCTNGQVVVADVDTILLKRYDFEDLATWHYKFVFDSVSIGPDKLGLLVRLWTGSASGNSEFLLYRTRGNELVLVGYFQGSMFKLLTDRVTNGMHDIYTQWHMSAGGGPYVYWHWTGTSYEVYKTGDTRPGK